MRGWHVVLGLTVAVVGASGQELAKGQFPEGWRVRADRADQAVADVAFVAMAPGWHITTGPAVILYDPSRRSDGEYRVESEIFLFDPGQRREAYGIFIGGRSLEGADQSYTYFVIRQTGEFLIRRRSGVATPIVVDWTAHPAILKWADRGEAATAKNVLAIDVGAETVRFSVNGVEVASLPRAQVDAEGVVGLRVNHALNLHVTKLVVTQR